VVQRKKEKKRKKKRRGPQANRARGDGTDVYKHRESVVGTSRDTHG
jgi:ribonuclease HI